MIKNIILFVILGCLTAGLVLIKYSPCDTPITFSIGTIDSRFEITKEELIDDAKSAANIWNSIENKQLLTYDPASTFTINMVYDSRQELTSKIDELNKDLQEQQNDIDPKIEEFKQQQAVFEKKVQDLNSEIQYWNSHGGAPKEEYDKLVAQQEELREEGRQLNATALSLGQKTQDYNVNARQLNQTIDNYQRVLEYKPEEGLYEQEGSKRKISIFIDVDKADFLHTLAHEFGHALGMDHVNNSSAIMYHQTTSTLEPSEQDIDQLNQICLRRPLYEVAGQRIKSLMQIINERYQAYHSQ